MGCRRGGARWWRVRYVDGGGGARVEVPGMAGLGVQRAHRRRVVHVLGVPIPEVAGWPWSQARRPVGLHRWAAIVASASGQCLGLLSRGDAAEFSAQVTGIPDTQGRTIGP